MQCESISIMMNEIETITSVHNPRIRQLLLLQQKSAERRKAGLFVVEGRRELQHCIDAGYEIDTVFYSEELGVRSEELGRPPLIPLKGEDGSRLATSNQLLKVSGSLYERIAYRGSTEGVIALVRSRSLTLADLQLGEAPLVMVLERVEKPGNLGAVLRSADAAGVDAVIECDPLTDLYNPNLIRSSIGAVFTVPCVACSSDECIAWLKDNGISILTAQLQDSSLYYDTNMTGPTAIVMGTEATGLTEAWRQAADAHIRIPMLGRLDSLNVSVSAAILLYEAVRQRTLKS